MDINLSFDKCTSLLNLSKKSTLTIELELVQSFFARICTKTIETLALAKNARNHNKIMFPLFPFP